MVVGQPSSVVGVGGARTHLEVNATGESFLPVEKGWVDIAGATSRTLSITDLTFPSMKGIIRVVNNSLGSVTSSVIQLDVNGSLTEGLVGWWKFDEMDGNISTTQVAMYGWKFNQWAYLDRERSEVPLALMGLTIT